MLIFFIVDSLRKFGANDILTISLLAATIITVLMILLLIIVITLIIIHMGKNLLFQKPVVSKVGLFYIIIWLICQKFGLFFETTGFETTGFSPYK